MRLSEVNEHAIEGYFDPGGAQFGALRRSLVKNRIGVVDVNEDLARLGVPGRLSTYQPQLEYLLIEENQYTEADLAELHNLVAAIIRFERPESQEAVLRLIDVVNDWLDGKPELKRILAIWIRAIFLRQSKYSLVIPKVRDLKELKMTLADRLDQWAEQHRQEGIEKGEALLLQRLLVRRFGALSTERVACIAAATPAQLETWGDRVLDATSLDEIFGETRYGSA